MGPKLVVHCQWDIQHPGYQYHHDLWECCKAARKSEIVSRNFIMNMIFVLSSPVTNSTSGDWTICMHCKYEALKVDMSLGRTKGETQCC